MVLLSMFYFVCFISFFASYILDLVQKNKCESAVKKKCDIRNMVEWGVPLSSLFQSTSPTTITYQRIPSLTHKQFWDICSFEHLMVANQIRKGKVKGGEQKWEPQMKQPESPCRTHGQGKNQIVACILQLWIFLPELSAHTMAEPSDQIRDNTEMQQLCIAAIITRLNN